MSNKILGGIAVTVRASTLRVVTSAPKVQVTVKTAAIDVEVAG